MNVLSHNRIEITRLALSTTTIIQPSIMLFHSHLSHLHFRRFLSRLIHTHGKNGDGNNKNTPCKAFILHVWHFVTFFVAVCRRSTTTTTTTTRARSRDYIVSQCLFLWIPFSTFLSVDSSFTCTQQHHFFILALSSRSRSFSLFHSCRCLFFFHFLHFLFLLHCEQKLYCASFFCLFCYFFSRSTKINK